MSAPLEAAAQRLLAAGMTYELARDLIADEIADAGAGCIARVARTADSPRVWRMVAEDLTRWQHPSCPGGYAEQLAVAARLMRCADRAMGAALAVATLDGWTGERTAIDALELSPPPAPPLSLTGAQVAALDAWTEVVPCGAGLDAHVEPVPGCTRGRVVATLRERATGRMAHPLAFAEGATRDEAVTAAVEMFRALDAAERERDVAVAQLAPLLALHDAVVAAAALPGAGHTPAELIAALRGQGAEMARVALCRTGAA